MLVTPPITAVRATHQHAVAATSSSDVLIPGIGRRSLSARRADDANRETKDRAARADGRVRAAALGPRQL